MGPHPVDEFKRHNTSKSLKAQSLFRPVWWLSNALLAVTLVATIWSGVSEFYIRQYLKGFPPEPL